MKWLRETTDTLTVIKEMASGHLKIRDYLKSLSGKKELAVFSMDDPLPFLTELFLLPYLWKKRGF